MVEGADLVNHGALFIQSMKSAGMRRLAIVYAHSQLCEAFPGLDFMSQLQGRAIRVCVAPRWWWWALLQLPRVLWWLRVRRRALAALGTVQADVTLHVGFE
jgi:hypothetical protein